MKLLSVLSNAYRLDGGAMFGNTPKPLWEKWIPADERNRLSMATRAFLAVTQKSAVLIDAGIGAYLEPKLRDRYGVYEPEQILLKSLAQCGFTHTDITHVILSHLHFDHGGGLLSAWQEGKEPELLFPNARFYVSEAAWERATHPHPRDRSSFDQALNRQLDQSDRLILLKSEAVLTLDELEIRFVQSDGHTPGLLCSHLRWDNQRAVFASDLVAGRPWVHLPTTMGYDRFPELVVEEKEQLLRSIAADNAWLCYVHDPHFAMSRVQADEERSTYVPVEEQVVCQLS